MASVSRQDEKNYYRLRAEQEIKLAQSAEHPAAVRAHYGLAGYYLDHVYNGSGSPTQPRNFLLD